MNLRDLRDSLPTHLGPFPIKGVRHRAEDNVYILTIAGFNGPEERIYHPTQFASLIAFRVDDVVLDRVLAPKLDRVITVGEIVARRLWRVGGFELHSMTTDTSWPARVPLQGDNPAILKSRGIHAYKLDQPLDEIMDYWFAVFRKRTIAVGTVYLFGDVIEFDNAYRAQYAAVRTIDKVYSDFKDSVLERTRKIKLEKILRKLYCNPDNIKRENRAK